MNFSRLTETVPATKNTLFVVSLLLLSSLVACAPHVGEITGRITLEGKPPPEILIDLKANPKIDAKHPNGLTTRRYEVSPDGGLVNALVYIRREFEGMTFKPPAQPSVLDHLEGLFQPYVMGVQVGQPLRLHCTDGTICGFQAVVNKNQEFVASPGLGTVDVLRTFANA
ncbi:MAG: hypothetical protein EXS31_15045 [Pedosphaera sp.]|nr:hypothetical protein [Pedosphaera sp.]